MKKKRVIAILSILLILFSAMIPQSAFAEDASDGGSSSPATSTLSTTYSSKSAIPAEVKERIQNEVLDSLSTMLSVNLFEKEMDEVVFATNQFLTDATFTGPSGPFWYILQMSMCLAALFSIIVGAGMAYKMMVKHETFDVFKIMRIFGISIVLALWYPSYNNRGSGWSVLDYLAYIPNCIGSWTCDMYEAEAAQVETQYKQLVPYMKSLSANVTAQSAAKATVDDKLTKMGAEASKEVDGVKQEQEKSTEAKYEDAKANYASIIVFIDKILMFLSFVIYRIGWWSTIYCQQIMLGMLTIFGPIQWAFSVLPKWEGAWAKWMSRYLTVHFYGAMLYFVGFYVLLLFDIVICIQIENLKQLVATEGTISSYIMDACVTSGYLLVASMVALKCLSLVPDLASWMIPEGDVTFSARGFGEGVASSVRGGAMSAGSTLTKGVI